MLTIKEATEYLNNSGILASEELLTRWIDEGRLKADVIKRRKIAYRIHVKDLTDFKVQILLEQQNQQLVEAIQENQNLKDHIEILLTRIHIEEAKVRSLKKMVNVQKGISDTAPIDPADLLGLENETNHHTVKKEFKKLLKALHPDRGGDERLFKVFNNHYNNANKVDIQR